jgi:hypothetical protein
MDVVRLVPWLLLVLAAVAAVFVYRVMRARARREEIRRALAESPSEDEAFLDSSHISGPISGLTDRGGDAAARAAKALRRGDPPRS